MKEVFIDSKRGKENINNNITNKHNCTSYIMNGTTSDNEIHVYCFYSYICLKIVRVKRRRIGRGELLHHADFLSILQLLHIIFLLCSCPSSSSFSSCFYFTYSCSSSYYSCPCSTLSAPTAPIPKIHIPVESLTLAAFFTF